MNDPLAMLALSVGDASARLLLPHLEAVSLPDGAALYRDGVASSYVHVLVDGEVEIRQESLGRAIVLAVRGPGSWLGEVGFIDSGPATATVVAKGPVRALRIDHPTLLGLIREHPAVASVLLRHVSREMALRIAQSSSGVVEHVGPGRYVVRKPEEVRSWVARTLGWLVGGE